jgi:hypothetical protein
VLILFLVAVAFGMYGMYYLWMTSSTFRSVVRLLDVFFLMARVLVSLLSLLG